MPSNNTTLGIDYMNRKQLRQLAVRYNVPFTNVTTEDALITAVKSK